jgi:DNA-binding transcriptional MocR family regulator
MSIKAQDIVVLLKVARLSDGWTIQQLSDDLGISLSAVHRSIARLQEAGFLDPRRRVNSAQAMEFLEHAVRYVFPPKFEGESRGIPTAGAAPPLRDLLAPSDSIPPVWPHPLGDTRGVALAPIHPSVPEAARRDPQLAESLAAVDAIRTGDARLRGLAVEELRSRLTPRVPNP